MKEAPQLLVIDLDGTLLNPSGRVSDENRRALDAAREANVQIMIATGRIVPECREILESIGYQGPIVIASGAALVDWPGGDTLAIDPLAPEDVARIVDIMGRHDCTSVMLKDSREAGYEYLLIDDDHLHPISEWWFKRHGLQPRTASDSESDPHPQATLRVACLGTPEQMAKASRDLRATLGSRINSRHWPAVGPEGMTVHMLEVFGPAVDKWTMVLRYCRQHDIDPQRVAAIGDGLNDVGLLRGVGFGIAVANADHDVQNAADAITKHHEDDGVAHAVTRLLGGWS